MYLSPKPQGSTTILVKVIKLPRSLGTFAIFSAYCAMKYAGKGKVAAAAPQRAREQSLQKISWNGGDHLALQCHIKSNQLKHNGAFLPPCSVLCTLKLTPFWHCNCPLGNARYIYTYQQHIEDYKVFKLVQFPSYLSFCYHFMSKANFLVLNSSMKQIEIVYPSVPSYYQDTSSFNFWKIWELDNLLLKFSNL